MYHTHYRNGARVFVVDVTLYITMGQLTLWHTKLIQVAARFLKLL